MTQSKIYLACVKPLEDPELYERFLAKTSQERREKVGRYRFLKDRLLSLGAEALLRLALREAGYTGEAGASQESCPGVSNALGKVPAPQEDLAYAYKKNGKPYLPAFPDFYFNWSHSGEYVMLAVSNREVGCDIEQIRPVELKLARFAFDPQEYERVAACSGAERDELFFRYWVLKESFMKATGEGLSLGSSSFHLEFGPPVCVIKDGTQQNYSFLEGDIPGYRYAVCLEGDLPEVQKEIADLREIL